MKVHEKLGLEPDAELEVPWDFQDGDFEVLSNEVVDHRRWSVGHELIAKHKPSGLLFGLYYEEPATESQEVYPPEASDLYEVEPYQVTETKYRKKA